MDYMIILLLLSEDKDNKKFYMIKNINCFLWKFVVKDILYSLGVVFGEFCIFDFSLIKSVQIPFASEPMA